MTDFETQLHQLISAHFTTEDLRTLCFALDFDYEELGGVGKSAIVRELILHMARIGRMDDLCKSLNQVRPKVSWPPVPDGFEEKIIEKYKASPPVTPFDSIAITLSSPFSSEDVSQKLQKWFKRNIWVDKESFLKLSSSHNLHLHYWPIFFYTGRCRIYYSIRRHKRYGTRFNLSPKSKGIPFPLLESEGWDRFHKSTSLPVKLVLPANRYMPTQVDANELFQQTLQVIDGSQPGIKPHWRPLSYLYKLRHVFSKILKVIPYYVIEVMTKGMYESADPNWPNLSSVKIGFTPTFQQNPHVVNDTIAKQFRSHIEQEVAKAVQNTDHAQTKKEDIFFSEELVFAFYYPFWSSELMYNKEKQSIVIDGKSGKIIIASLTANITIFHPFNTRVSRNCRNLRRTK